MILPSSLLFCLDLRLHIWEKTTKILTIPSQVGQYRACCINPSCLTHSALCHLANYVQCLTEIKYRSCASNPHIRTWWISHLVELLCWAELMSWWVYSLLSLSPLCLFLSLSLCLSLSVCLCVSLFVARSSIYTDTVRLQG